MSEGSVGQNDNRFDALQHYLVAVNMQDKNGQLRIVGEPQYYNLNSDATFIPNYPNSAGKMRMWSNDTLSSRLVHSIQMMGKASPYYNDIQLKIDVDQFVEDKQEMQTHGIRWEQYPLISAIDVPPVLTAYSIDGLVNGIDVSEVSCIALTRPVLSAINYKQLLEFKDQSASNKLSVDAANKLLSVNNAYDVTPEIPRLEKTITGNYASYYDRDASVSGILSVWLSAGEDKRLSAFDLYKCQVSVYNWQQPIVDPKARCAIPTSIEGMVSSSYDAEAGVISVENIMFGHSERGNISAFSLNGYGMSAYYAYDRRVEYSDAVSAVYVGRDFSQEDYDKAVEDWKRPPRDSLEHWLSTEYPSLQAYCDSLSNTVSVFFVQ